MEFEKVLERRYSCRSFSDKPVEDEKLNRVLEAGRICPTARNAQPQRVYVAKSQEARAKLAELSPCTYNAPVILIVCSDTEAACASRGDWKDYAETDPTIAVSFMMLTAENEGLDTCWVCMFDGREVADAFDMPENVRPYHLLLLGYAAEDAAPANMHDERNSLDAMVLGELRA